MMRMMTGEEEEERGDGEVGGWRACHSRRLQENTRLDAQLFPETSLQAQVSTSIMVQRERAEAAKIMSRKGSSGT